MPIFLNPRTALLARHAQHVVLVHFPIALFITGVLLDILSRSRRDSPFATAAYLNLTAAGLTVVPTVGTGLLAWQFALQGKRLHGVLLQHLISAAISTLIILCCWWLHHHMRRTGSARLPASRLLLEALGVVLLAFTAHLGGWLSGVNS
jgi:uncharacterized membrane protein